MVNIILIMICDMIITAELSMSPSAERFDDATLRIWKTNRQKMSQLFEIIRNESQNSLVFDSLNLPFLLLIVTIQYRAAFLNGQIQKLGHFAAAMRPSERKIKTVISFLCREPGLRIELTWFRMCCRRRSRTALPHLRADPTLFEPIRDIRRLWVDAVLHCHEW